MVVFDVSKFLKIYFHIFYGIFDSNLENFYSLESLNFYTKFMVDQGLLQTSDVGDNVLYITALGNKFGRELFEYDVAESLLSSPDAFSIYSAIERTRESLPETSY
ncbi:hypothetical protein NI382_20455 [Vibrio parahaemolyticus]|nr:hypothetical protein NI382_20455 [Vibrio parahaemolyticus]